MARGEGTEDTRGQAEGGGWMEADREGLAANSTEATEPPHILDPVDHHEPNVSVLMD